VAHVSTLDARPARPAWKRWIGPLIGLAAVTLAAFLLHRTLSRYTLDEIGASLAAIPTTRIALSLACAAGSYLCLTGFDWLALRYVGSDLPYRKNALASFCSLSLGHNIGFAALSSGAVRYRFYSRWGVSGADVARIIVFCGVTVGIGLATLGGGALLMRPDLAAKMTGLDEAAIIGLGIACLAVVAGYVALAAFVRKPLRIRKWTLEMPPLRLALGQVAIGSVNFAFVAGCLYHALAGLADVTYVPVATAYVIANVGALISHVPGGLGVIETVVLYLLPGANVVGGLVAFRVIYFLVPLAIGAPLFGISELVLKKRKPHDP
jgi:uncharacterized membrane protein YbhN (UPF0104 family)